MHCASLGFHCRKWIRICSNLKTEHCSNYPRSNDVKCACECVVDFAGTSGWFVILWLLCCCSGISVCAKNLWFAEIYAIENQILNTAPAFDTRSEQKVKHNNVYCMQIWANEAIQGLIRDLKVYLIERKLFSWFSLRARIEATANIYFNRQNHFARISHSFSFGWQLLSAPEPVTTHIIWLAKHWSRLCAKFAVEYICGFQLIARLVGLKYESDTRVKTIYGRIWKSNTNENHKIEFA